jgi:quinol monooxygenase YgiN
MAKCALWVTLKATPGKEKEADAFLKHGALMSRDEPKTVDWYSVKLGEGSYGVFNTFVDEGGRNAHLTGKIADAIMAKVPELFADELTVEKLEILARR